MKLLSALVAVAVLAVSAAALAVSAQTPQPAPYKVVFDLTSSDPLDQQAVLRWINEVKGMNPKKQEKKKPAKTLKEKRAENHARKDARG